MSLAGNARRARKLSDELVLKKLAGVHRTWNELIQNDKWKKMGIWMMYHLTTPEGKFPKWEVEERFRNTDILKNSLSALKSMQND